MEKTLIVYKSKYGTTRKYAEWLAEDLSARALEARDVRQEDLDGADTLIFGGGLYAGGILVAPFLKKHYDQLRGKRVALFTCGLGDPAVADNVANIRSSVARKLGSGALEELALFHLRGGMDYSKLSFIHRKMMTMVLKAVEHRKEDMRTEEEWQMINTFGKTVDFTDRASLAPLVAWARGEGQGRA